MFNLFIFTFLGTLAIAGWLDEIDKDSLGLWLSERQTAKGGFNGRPEKLPDVCYSWWVLSSMKMIEREAWFDSNALKKYILECQDSEGGISDKPGNNVDIFHTFFGLASLSLIDKQLALEEVDPVFALPKRILKDIVGLKEINKI